MKSQPATSDSCVLRSPATLRWFCLLLLVATTPGCVRRRMTVRTNPPGAMVYVDHQPIGTTPVSTNFTYYGTRQFEIIKDGYRTEKFLRRLNPPWYQWPVLDFISESLWPYEKRDERVIDVQLSPDVNVPTEALIRSGEDLRRQAAKGVVVAPPPNALAPSGANLPPLGPTAPLIVPTGPTPIMPTLPPPLPLVPVAPPPISYPLPPSSLPASEVTPGPSYRQDVDAPSTPAVPSSPSLGS